MRRTSRSDCDHEPVLMADPANPDWVAVECLRCHATTGYALRPQEAWEAWNRGDVAVPGDLMEDE